LIRQAFPGFQSPITADELAGLACSDGIESRIVIEKHGRTPWEVLHGPFDEALFAHLPETHWTLLVQDTDKYIPELTSLLEHFRFIPDWRIDDIMISYAPAGGSVGPHTDQYDVFLLQAMGQRRWMIDPLPEHTALLQGPELRILEQFKPRDEWILEPGDMLYLPPGVAHHGVAQGDCLTFSVGFRAPSQVDLLGAVISRHLQALDEQFYSDPGISPQNQPAEIRPDALLKLRRLLDSALQLSEQEKDNWICEWLSEPKPGIYPLEPEQIMAQADFERHWQQQPLIKSPETRVYFRRGESDTLYINGETHPGMDRGLVDALGSHAALPRQACPDAHLGLVYAFYCKGYYYFD
jgi:50S ribosomal protein L16 3-hydroxylase